MLNKVCSSNGDLTAVDLSDIPFVPKRLFIVNNVPNQTLRSDHAHKKDYQILLCLTGSLNIELIDKSLCSKISIINAGDYLHIPQLTWSRIRFLTNDSSILCLCSEKYDENEYIRNYNEFLRIINEDNI